MGSVGVGALCALAASLAGATLKPTPMSEVSTLLMPVPFLAEKRAAAITPLPNLRNRDRPFGTAVGALSCSATISASAAAAVVSPPS
jgi:hypothetical protein